MKFDNASIKKVAAEFGVSEKYVKDIVSDVLNYISHHIQYVGERDFLIPYIGRIHLKYTKHEED